MYKRIIIYLIIALFSFSNYTVQAQSRALKVKRKEFKKQENGFKDAWDAVKDGNYMFHEGRASYRDARERYLIAYKYNPDNAELNYNIGKCFLFSDNRFEAIKYFETAFNLKADVSFDIHLMLGRAYHQTLQFEKAILEYNYFISNASSREKSTYQSQVNLAIQQCENGKLLVADPKRVVIKNPGEAINSVYDDYGPVIPADGSKMYFTSRRSVSNKSKISLFDKEYFEDAYVSQLQDEEWTKAIRLDGKISPKRNSSNIGVVGISPDMQKLYLYKGNENKGDLYISNYKDHTWSKPKPFSKINTNYRDVSVCLSSNESTLYFVSSNKKKSYGGTDIFYCTKKANGKWDKPKNLGWVVNTFFDELGVSLSANDSVLYFSSKGHNSMGGYDVFKTTLSSVGLWSQPVNLGYPINTPNDDIFYHEMSDGKTAYYASNREKGIGGMDIFKIIYLGAEKPIKPADVNDRIAGLKEPIDIFFTPSEGIKVDTSLILRGFINDSQNKNPIIAKIELVDPQISQIAATAISDSTGNYTMKIQAAKSYGVEIVAKGYLLYLDVVDLSQRTYGDVIVKNFLLDKVEVGAKVILKNIYFNTGKATLKKESYIGLDNIIQLLQSNETLRIEVSGHTDNTGSTAANTKLSTARAKAVVDYLVKKGIAKNRLTYKGYASSQPVAPNKTAKGRAQNRRVEFKVLSK
jgi:outer membrane protein OmpA-like peptidoglycan-associated protein/tetratricopeptide (TPR) repeat protein